jgi:hypothetical protein
MKITVKEFVDLCLSRNIEDLLAGFDDEKKEVHNWYDEAEEYLMGAGFDVSDKDIKEYRKAN